MFLSELCDIIGVPRPAPTSPDPAKNLYVFDRTITQIKPDGTTAPNYIDLYKARHFVSETKQGTNHCSCGLRPSLTSESPEKPASLSSGYGIDGHRPPLQAKTGHGKRGTLAFDKALERAYHQARGTSPPYLPRKDARRS